MYVNKNYQVFTINNLCSGVSYLYRLVIGFNLINKGLRAVLWLEINGGQTLGFDRRAGIYGVISNGLYRIY